MPVAIPAQQVSIFSEAFREMFLAEPLHDRGVREVRLPDERGGRVDILLLLPMNGNLRLVCPGAAFYGHSSRSPCVYVRSAQPLWGGGWPVGAILCEVSSSLHGSRFLPLADPLASPALSCCPNGQVAGPEEIARAFPVMHQLRPHLEEAEFVPRVRRMQQSGFHLALLEDEGRVVAAAGFRFIENLLSGRIMYVDDLVASLPAQPVECWRPRSQSCRSS